MGYNHLPPPPSASPCPVSKEAVRPLFSSLLPLSLFPASEEAVRSAYPFYSPVLPPEVVANFSEVYTQMPLAVRKFRYSQLSESSFYFWSGVDEDDLGFSHVDLQATDFRVVFVCPNDWLQVLPCSQVEEVFIIIRRHNWVCWGAIP